jgi:hypothetical protein
MISVKNVVLFSALRAPVMSNADNHKEQRGEGIDKRLNSANTISLDKIFPHGNYDSRRWGENTIGKIREKVHKHIEKTILRETY